MAKNRQIETDLFLQGWFYELSNEAKILYIYCYLNADNAGIIEMIKRRLEFDLQIDVEKAFIEIQHEFTIIGNNRFLIKRILTTQFPNGLCSPEHPFQKSVIKLLENEGIDSETYELIQALPKPYTSLTEALPKAHSNSISKSNSQSSSLSNSNKPDLQKKSSKEVEKWNDLKIGTKVPDRDHTIMRWDDFLQYQSERGRRSCEKLDAPMVFLSDKEYNKLKEKYKSDEIVIAMIRVMNNWKGKRKFAHQRNLNDYLAIDDSWVLEKAEKELRILNGTTVDKIRKQEAMKAEIQKNMGGISFEQ
jgi:hypothetical protein